MPIMEVTLPPCAPPRVRLAVPVIAPTFDRAIVPVPPMIEALEPRETKPVYTAGVALELISAPPLVMPVPFKVSELYALVVWP